MSEQTNETGDFTACPHWGQGGRYVVDANGRRVLVGGDEVQAATTDQAANESDAGKAKSVKENKRA